jgi:hypothetical protein
MELDQKISKGQEHKNKGNEYFKEQQFKQALKEYYHALLYLKGLDNSQLSLALGDQGSKSSLSDEIKSSINSVSLLIYIGSNCNPFKYERLLFEAKPMGKSN